MVFGARTNSSLMHGTVTKTTSTMVTTQKQQPKSGKTSQPKIRPQRGGQIAQPRHIPFVNIEEDQNMEESGSNQPQSVDDQEQVFNIQDLVVQSSSNQSELVTADLESQQRVQDQQDPQQQMRENKSVTMSGPEPVSAAQEHQDHPQANNGDQQLHPVNAEQARVEAVEPVDSEARAELDHVEQSNLGDLRTPPVNKKLISIADVVFKTPIGVSPSSRMRGLFFQLLLRGVNERKLKPETSEFRPGIWTSFVENVLISGPVYGNFVRYPDHNLDADLC